MSLNSLATTSSFGEMLRLLRIYATLTQAELATAVGFSESHISRLEKGLRLPVVADVENTFVPALGLQDEPRLAARLVALARLARGEKPLAPLADPAQGLPLPPTPILGREADIDLLAKRLLEGPGRLLTLLGPPGIGKTRLALAAGARLAPLFHDGACFVPLAQIADPALVAASIADVLAIPDSAEPTRTRIISHLRSKEMLLILDNFEQVIPAADLVAALLSACGGVRILVTSRERLHLRAEGRYTVPPLPAAAAEALFRQRATAVDPAFRPTEALPEVCARLDYLPLAIELSAVRCDLFTLDQILRTLRETPLDLLSDGPLDLPGHQTTLRDAIGYSYQLLSPAEKHLFRHLSVFIGGFTAETPALFNHAPAVLQGLLAKSLIQTVTTGGGERRFEQLDTIRHYARELLDRHGETPAATASHARTFRALAAQSAGQGPGKKAALRRLESELNNVRAALRYMLDTDPLAALTFTGDLREFWYGSGLNSEGRGWLAEALAKSAAPTLARGYALLAVSELALAQSDYDEARAAADAANEIFLPQADRRGQALVAHTAGWLMRESGSLADAYTYFMQALALAQAIEDAALQVRVYTSLITILSLTDERPDELEACFEACLRLLDAAEDEELYAYWLARKGAYELLHGRAAEAQEMLAAAVDIFQRLGVKREEAWAREELGEACFVLGQWEAALAQYDRAEVLFTAVGETLGLMLLVHHRGHVACAAGQLAAAEALYSASLRYFHEMGHERTMVRCVAGLGLVAEAREDWPRTAVLLSSALAHFAALPSFLPPQEMDRYRRAAGLAVARASPAQPPLALEALVALALRAA
jgi:predicted ATPase/transcriptional regulator with XRE-family HTH domain